MTLANPLIVQSYLNTRDSLTRIWPWIDAAAVFDPNINIAEFNFYYEADARHNPARAVVWTDAYVDPAGKGWLVSAIAPVYRGDVLEAVVGTDVTIDRIVADVLGQDIPWQGFLLLIGKSGTLLALPPQGEKLFHLKELTHTITSTPSAPTPSSPRHSTSTGGGPCGDRQAAADAAGRHRPPRRPGTAPDRLADHPVGRLEAHEPRAGAGRVRPLTLAEPGPRGDRLDHARGPRRLLPRVLHVSVPARPCAEPSIAEPLTQIERMAHRIAVGEYEQAIPEFDVTEFRHTVGELRQLGRLLGDSNRAREEAESRLTERNEELSTILIALAGWPRLLRRRRLGDGNQSGFPGC